ncbi:MAG TPA: methyltransferase domain-containing protein [Acidimicrobiales bacterium]|nr:methyltransferase domain-containing protein [Acidimicrobiales bacterium]
MAVEADFTYLRSLIEGGVVSGPVLEIGSRAWQGVDEGNARAVCKAAEVDWEGTDIVEGEGVDFVLDILDVDAVAAVDRQWSTVLLFNLLEHVYNPILALEHACRLVAPGGVIVVVGPAVWQLHDYPKDYWRPMPDFFLEFGHRNAFEVPFDLMMWIVEEQVIPVSRFSLQEQKQLPCISRPGVFEVWGKRRAYWSRGVHLLLRTFGGATQFPHAGLGVVIRKPV